MCKQTHMEGKLVSRSVSTLLWPHTNNITGLRNEAGFIIQLYAQR
jgi:hypothetical protein